MRLKKLELQGFKSFADKTEIIVLDGVTTIVGPNGSGKSNISDAVRWVLGEQSVKNLRGQKMEDVIFAGTQARKKVGFAEVSLYLDNSDESLPVEFKEVVVTNTIPLKDTVIPEKIKQVSVAPLLGEAISRIHDDKSVSSLFGFEIEYKKD